MTTTTKTLNPIHFEDLEPHRFEDLVRQLTYDFKNWRLLEATGRLGSDDGYDARGFEIVDTKPSEVQNEDADENDTYSEVAQTEKLWQIQCKREKTITPAKIERYVDEMIPNGSDVPYGVIFAAACDFSKHTRDKFQQKLREKGVTEFYLWGKADLEDTLFQPKNDHLLYAYFGISLIIRRRTIKSQLRGWLTIKSKAAKYLGAVNDKSFIPILIRNVADTNYPYSSNIPDFKEYPHWKMYYFVGHTHEGIMVRQRTYPAYREINPETGEIIKWDYTEEVNLALTHNDVWHKEKDGDDNFRRAHDFLDSIPESNRAFFEIDGVIPYDRIVEIDPIGDSIINSPHIFVEVRNKSFFDHSIAHLAPRGGYSATFLITQKDDENRIKYFPKKLPKTIPPQHPLPPIGSLK